MRLTSGSETPKPAIERPLVDGLVQRALRAARGGMSEPGAGAMLVATMFGGELLRGSKVISRSMSRARFSRIFKARDTRR